MKQGFTTGIKDSDIKDLVLHSLKVAAKEESGIGGRPVEAMSAKDEAIAGEPGEEDRKRRALDRGYSPYVGIEHPDRPRQGIVDSLYKALAPAARGDNATAMSGILRANFGEQARVREVADRELIQHAKVFDKMPVKEGYKFIDAMEHGTQL